MAKFTVTHTCGHTCKHDDTQRYQHHLNGGLGIRHSRDEQIAWQQSVECPDCHKAKLDAERQQANAEAAAAAAERGLPALVGSEKQITWAETIRAQKLAQIEPILAEVLERFAQISDPTPDNVFCRDFMVAKVEKMKAEISAKWWIDNRDQAFDKGTLMREVGAALRAQQQAA